MKSPKTANNTQILGLYRKGNPENVQKKVPGIASVILIGGGLMMVMALIGLAVSFSGTIENTYLEFALKTPGFDYKIENGKETGNETFEAFVLMRWIGMFLFVLVLIVAAISKVLESSESEIMPPKTSSKMISKALFFILIIAIFPPMWDGAAGVIENVSIWIMNPLYSFDEKNPCPSGWTQADIQKAYDDSKYKKIGTSASDVCKPEFKAKYVFGQMLRNTEVAEIKTGFGIVEPDKSLNVTSILKPDPGRVRFGATTNQALQGNYLGGLAEGITKGTEGIFTNVFLGLTKAMIAIQILIMSLMLGILADMLVGMVIAGLPVFLMLSLIPKAEVVANRMIDCIPALMLLPIMSAIILVVGAGAIAESAENATEVPGWGHVYVWITAMGVVFFAITLPTLMVPLLGTVSQMANQTVSSAISTGTMVSGMMTSAAATGAMGARRQGLGIGGQALAMMKGLGSGAVTAHGNVSAPGLGGANFMPPMSQMMTGADTNLGMPVPQQQDIAGQATDNVMTSGHTSENVGKMERAFPGFERGENWGERKEDDIASIDKHLAENHAYRANWNDEQRAAYDDWKGITTVLAEKGPDLNKGDVKAAVDTIKAEGNIPTGVQDKFIRDAFVEKAAEMQNVEKHVMEDWIRKNSS